MSVRNILDGTIKLDRGERVVPDPLHAGTVTATKITGQSISRGQLQITNSITTGRAIVQGTLNASQLAVSGGITMAGKPLLREEGGTAELTFTLTMQDDTTKTIKNTSKYSLTSIGQYVSILGLYSSLNVTGMDMPKKVSVTVPVETYGNPMVAYNTVHIRTDNQGALYQATCTTGANETGDCININLKFTQDTNVPLLVIKLAIPIFLD